MGKFDLTGALKRNGFVFTDAETNLPTPRRKTSSRLNASMRRSLQDCTSGSRPRAGQRGKA